MLRGPRRGDRSQTHSLPKTFDLWTLGPPNYLNIPQRVDDRPFTQITRYLQDKISTFQEGRVDLALESGDLRVNHGDATVRRGPFSFVPKQEKEINTKCGEG